MGPKKRTVFHEVVKDAEHFEEIIHEDFGKMAVIDCHLEWCGPCVAMESNYPALFFLIDDPDTRISFWQCAEDKLPDLMKEKLHLTCVPRFLIYEGGNLKQEIQGARYVDL